IWKLGPPFAAIFAASIWAPASAGESNGFMLLVRSTAVPMTIGALAELFPAAVVAAAVRPAATATSPSAATIPPLGIFIFPPREKDSASATLRLPSAHIQRTAEYSGRIARRPRHLRRDHGVVPCRRRDRDDTRCRRRAARVDHDGRLECLGRSAPLARLRRPDEPDPACVARGRPVRRQLPS